MYGFMKTSRSAFTTNCGKAKQNKTNKQKRGINQNKIKCKHQGKNGENKRKKTNQQMN